MKYMAKAGYDPAAAIELQKTFVKLSRGKQPNWLEGLFASHPPSQERVDENIKTARQLNVKGITNKEVYQQKIAHLKKSEPAYEKYEDAKQALKSNDTTKAMSLLNEAITIEPREGLFHALKGDIHYNDKKYSQAEQAFDKAVNLNPQFFLFYLERGLAREKLQQYNKSRTDLEKSIALLPTAPAHHALGNIALESKNTQAAKEHFAKAASSDSTVGRESAEQLARLELPKNPDKYFSYQGKTDSAGTVIVDIKNKSPLTVDNLEVIVGLYTGAGALVFRDRYQLSRKIAANADVAINTGVSANALGKNGQIKVDIVRANIADQ
jgi:tetratricopeptide (TPR) repeat protein